MCNETYENDVRPLTIREDTQMTTVTESVNKLLWEARHKTLSSAWDLLANAVRLFEQGITPLSCFLAMTCIEEVGKLIVLRMAQGLRLKGFPSEAEPPKTLNEKSLRRFTRDHLQKAVQAAACSLYINAAADRRQGVHPCSHIHRTSGIILLARSRRWMSLRNSCLYTDVDIQSAKTTSPFEVITRDHSYYMICMAFEVLSEQAEAGVGIPFIETPSKEAHQFLNDRLRDLTQFMERWSTTVDVDKVDFLANPEALRQEADAIEARGRQ